MFLSRIDRVTGIDRAMATRRQETGARRQTDREEAQPWDLGAT